MNNLKLNNKDVILSTILEYSTSKNIDNISLMEDFYQTITKEKSESNYLDEYLFILKPILNIKTIFETEEELFHVISYTLNKYYEDETLKKCDINDIDNVNSFLDEYFYDIFKDYYIKNKSISKKDYEECVISIFSNFILEKEIADILVGKYLEEKIMK
jgi:hypothetical protein